MCLTAYPGSEGNLRKYLARITGIIIGDSDSLDSTTPMQMKGSKGQEIVDDRVWIVSSHNPARMPGVPLVPGLPSFGGIKFESTKVICLVRNPFDAIMDLAKSFNPIAADFEPKWWSWFVMEQIEQYQNFFRSLVSDCVENKKNPILFVRYEDLQDSPVRELTEVMKYLLDVNDLAGTVAE